VTTHVTTQITSSHPVRDDLADLAPTPTTPVAAARPSRLWALAGLGAAVSGFVGTGSAIAVDAVYDSAIGGDAPAILDKLGGQVVPMLMFHVGVTLSAVLLSVFALGLHRRLAAVAPTGSLAPAAAAFGLLGTAVVLVMGTALDTEFVYAVAYPDTVVPEAAAVYNHWIGTVPGCWVLGGLAGLAMFRLSRTGGVPRWLGITGLVLGGFTVAIGISPLQYMAGLTGLLWLLVSSIGLLVGDKAFRRA
jgi:hypothetical protein